MVRYDITKEIYDGECKPTRVMLRANVSWGAFKKHVSILISQGLVVEKNILDNRQDRRSKVRYDITEEGKTFIRYLSRFM